MKVFVFKLKQLNKAEQVYLDQLAKRPAGLIFREVFSKAQNHINSAAEEKAIIAK